MKRTVTEPMGGVTQQALLIQQICPDRTTRSRPEHRAISELHWIGSLAGLDGSSVRHLHMDILNDGGQTIDYRKIRVKGRKTEFVDLCGMLGGIYYIRLMDTKCRAMSLEVEKVN